MAFAKSNKPTSATFRIDGWTVAWTPGMTPEIYPVQIDRVEPHSRDNVHKDGKIAWVWFRSVDRPSVMNRDTAMDWVIGAPRSIDDGCMPPHRIHKTREDAVEHVKKMAEARIAAIHNQMKAFAAT